MKNMRMLWSVNTLSPSVAEAFSISSSHAISWVDAMSNELKLMDGIDLAIAAPSGNKHCKLVCENFEGSMNEIDGVEI